MVGPSARGQGGHMARPTAGLPYIVDGDFRKRCQGYENAGHGGGRRAGLCGEAAGEVGQVATVWEHQHEVVQGQLQLWLDYVPENEEQGRVQGNFVEHFVGWRDEIEGRLTELARKEQSERVRLASVQAGDAVLQTVTVPLSEVRANPEECRPSSMNTMSWCVTTQLFGQFHELHFLTILN